MAHALVLVAAKPMSQKVFGFIKGISTKTSTPRKYGKTVVAATW
jgi:hypothetical protein